MTIRSRIWNEHFADAKQRLREPLWWHTMLVLPSSGFVLLLTAHLLFSVNSRAGHPADVISFPSEERKDGPIWLAVTPIDADIVVSTADRKVFRWPQNVRSMKELQPLVAYLKSMTQKEIEAIGLAKTASAHQTSAVIAPDQRLKYLHIRPIIYALAEAGIAQYAFETQNPGQASAPASDDKKHAIQSFHQFDRM